jgi:hypothetical protein
LLTFPSDRTLGIATNRLTLRAPRIIRIVDNLLSRQKPAG